MIVNGQTLQAEGQALEKLSHQVSAGNPNRCEYQVRFPAGARQ